MSAASIGGNGKASTGAGGYDELAQLSLFAPLAAMATETTAVGRGTSRLPDDQNWGQNWGQINKTAAPLWNDRSKFDLTFWVSPLGLEPRTG